MSRRRDDPFNNPFAEAGAALKGQVRQWRRQQKQQELEERLAATAPAEQPPAAQDEEAAFRRAMSGVNPLFTDERRASARTAAEPRIRSQLDEDAEAYALLADLVAGNGSFDIAYTTEYVEGVAPGVDRRLLRRLRRGDFSVQGHLDLHGLTREEARPAAERFLDESRVSRQRCVLLIHGRGLNSKDRVPVLKNALVSWLSHGRLGRRILAFATARPVDGGSGALYVLLRK